MFQVSPWSTDTWIILREPYRGWKNQWPISRCKVWCLVDPCTTPTCILCTWKGWHDTYLKACCVSHKGCLLCRYKTKGKWERVYVWRAGSIVIWRQEIQTCVYWPCPSWQRQTGSVHPGQRSRSYWRQSSQFFPCLSSSLVPATRGHLRRRKDNFRIVNESTKFLRTFTNATKSNVGINGGIKWNYHHLLNPNSVDQGKTYTLKLWS